MRGEAVTLDGGEAVGEEEADEAMAARDVDDAGDGGLVFAGSA